MGAAGTVAELGVNRRHEVGETVRRQEQVQLARHAQTLPAAQRPRDRALTHPREPQSRPRIEVDGGDHPLGAVGLDQPSGPALPDSRHAAQIGQDGRLLGRGQGEGLGVLTWGP